MKKFYKKFGIEEAEFQNLQNLKIREVKEFSSGIRIIKEIRDSLWGCDFCAFGDNCILKPTECTGMFRRAFKHKDISEIQIGDIFESQLYVCKVFAIDKKRETIHCTTTHFAAIRGYETTGIEGLYGESVMKYDPEILQWYAVKPDFTEGNASEVQ